MTRSQNRHGAIMPMFAVLLPVMLILCAIAINLSYMQLTSTELKVATDAAARAGGRAWSQTQNLETARDFAREAAELNMVSGNPLVLSTNEADGQIMFGNSARPTDGGRYVFTDVEDAVIEAGAGATGVQVNAAQPTNLLFTVANISEFTPLQVSVATQIDRDIALVVDRSGSMAFFKDEALLKQTIDELKSAGSISADDASRARQFREYSDAVLEVLQGEILEYAQTFRDIYRPGQGTPRHSRWELLEQSSKEFFQILRDTPQVEQVSIASFANTARLDLPLSKDMNLAENTVNELYPTGRTAVGDGILEAIAALQSDGARVSAVKSIVVFTDGISNQGIDPVKAAQQVIDNNPNVIIHTVTFSPGADQETMQEVAETGNGSHFHANTGDELKEVFRDIASSLPTIVTQ